MNNTPDQTPARSLADAAPALCDVCGEPVDASQTAVAVMFASGSPALVHPACYPAFSARERGRGNEGFAASPFPAAPDARPDATA